MQKSLSVFEKILFWLLVAVIVFVPLYPKLPLLPVKGTFVSIRAEDFLIFLVLGVWGLNLILSRKLKGFLQDRLNQALLLFFFIGAISLFSAVLLTHTVMPHLGFFHLLRRVEMMALLPFAVSVVKTKKQLKTVLGAVSGVVLLVTLYAFGQQYLRFPAISTATSVLATGEVFRVGQWTRVNSTFAAHYDLAVFLLMILSLAAALVFSFKRLTVILWTFILCVLSFIVLITTAARLSFVAAILGVASSLILVGKRNLVILMVIALIVAFAYPSELRDRLISTVTVNFLNEGTRYEATLKQQEKNKLNIPTLSVKIPTPAPESSKSATLSATPSLPPKLPPDLAPGEPTDTTQLGVYRSFAIRFNQEWPRAIRALAKNPLLGTGYSSLGLATDNDFLRSLGEVGILGTIAFSFILIEIVKRVWRNYRSGDRLLKYLSAGILSMIFAFLLNASFIDVFEASKVASLFWIFVGVSMAAGKME